jgi:dihydroxyacetone kinase
VKERGKGRRGDKTMLDAWIPATDAAANAVRRSATAEEMWRDVLAAAEAGAALTCSMIAARGRAARLGERALGHLDPGAASAVVILKAMALTFCDDSAKPMKIVGNPSPKAGKFPGRRFKVDGDRNWADDPAKDSTAQASGPL